MFWIFVTATAIFSRAFYSISTRALSTNVHIHANTQSVVMPAIAGLLSILLIPIFGFSLEGLREGWLVAIVLAVSQGLGNVIFFKGQKYLDSGLTQIALATKLFWSDFLSVLFLGSQFSAVQAGGMVALMVGIVATQNIRSHSKDTKKGMALIATSAVVFAVFAVSGADLANRLNPVVYVMVPYFGASLFALVVGWKDVKEDIPYLKSHAAISLRYTGFAAVTSLVYFTLLYYAYRLAPDAGVVTVLINAQVITTVVVALLVLKERDHLWRKLAAGFVIVVASYFISGV